MSCEKCDSCQGCNSCNVSCETCQGTCNSKQAFCTTGSQLASKRVTIDTWNSKSTNSLFLTASEWNDFITSIYNAYCKGKKSNGWGRTWAESEDNFAIYDNMDIRAGKTTGKAAGTEDFMYAKMFNGALKKMRYLASNSGGDDMVSPNDIIYASTFENLKSYATDSFLLHSNQCDNCNIMCDVTCDSCEGCNTNQCNTPTPCCDDCSQTTNK